MEISSKKNIRKHIIMEKHDAKRGELETKIVEDSKEYLDSNLSISTNIIEENEEEIKWKWRAFIW